MTIVVTLCSANYLAHAKTLGDSLVEHNPDIHFVIGLVDRLPAGLPSSTWQPYELLPVDQVSIPAYADMVRKYDVIEFNTAVKPFFMEHLYRRHSGVENVIYLDPDILVCSSFQALAEKLKKHPIVVTPHSCTHDDSKINMYYEGGMLTAGIYNLGFIGTSRSETTLEFLRWWQRRLEEFCYYRPRTGLFVDQIWVNLAPIYFAGVFVETNPGYNMCYWNHFERRLSVVNGRYVVNDKHPLIFYHFSSYDPKRPGVITKRRWSMIQTFEERPDLKPIFSDYQRRIMANGYERVNGLPYQLRSEPKPAKFSVTEFAKSNFRKSLRALPHPVRAHIKQMAEFTSRSFS